MKKLIIILLAVVAIGCSEKKEKKYILSVDDIMTLHEIGYLQGSRNVLKNNKLNKDTHELDSLVIRGLLIRGTLN